jgi:hypothetical protein
MPRPRFKNPRCDGYGCAPGRVYALGAQTLCAACVTRELVRLERTVPPYPKRRSPAALAAWSAAVARAFTAPTPHDDDA